MDTSLGSQLPLRRYRRRIVGWGAVGVVVIYAAGAAVSVNVVEDDLEGRVIAAFNDAEVFGVTARFTAQDGKLLCLNGSVEIPDDLLVRTRNLRGVDELVVDEDCASSGDAVPGDDADDEPIATDPPTTDLVPASDPGASTSVVESTEAVAEVVDSLLDVISNDSQFSTLRGLISSSGLDAMLSGDGPFTLFAPTNEAFEMLGPDAIAALGRDLDLLDVALRHHLAARALVVADIDSGALPMLDGTELSVDVIDGVELTSGESVATIVEPDLVASNGVVHAIDRVLLPEIADGLGTSIETTVTAVLSDGRLVLGGIVAEESQRAALVAAAQTRLDPSNVVDELVVDENAVPSAQTANLAALLAVMPFNLSAAEATLIDGAVMLTGTHTGPVALAAVEAAAAGLEGVTLDLTERAVATEDTAAALEAELNALVAAQPVVFEPNSADVSAESGAVLDRVAALANRIAAISIEIRGHTDTDGRADTNQTLSESRAASVLVALVERGVPVTALSSVGLGGSVPILGADGFEDKDASRRVEFVVRTQ